MSKARDSEYILIIDDDPGMRALLELMLRPLSLDIRYASDGVVALEVIGDRPPRLILLDLLMPGMDGYEVLAHLSKKEATAAIPVIVCSANISGILDETIRWPEQVVEVLSKTQLLPSALRDLVQAHLNNRPPA